MGLEHEEPPPDTDRALRAQLSRILGSPAGARFMGATEEIRAIDTSAPHPVYVTGRDEILDGKLFGARGPAAWRYLVVRAGEDMGAAEMGLDPEQDGKLEFGGLDRGRFVEATLEAVKVAEALPEVQEAEYDLRLLKVPSLRFVAVWLHGPKDLLLPLEDHRAGGLTAFAVYEPHDVLERLTPLALRNREAGDDESD